MFGNFNALYPADEHYFSAAFENGVKAITGVRSLVNVNVTNVGDAPVWLAVWDAAPAAGSNPAAAAEKTLVDLKPLPNLDWYQFSVPNGHDLRHGLWIGAYSTAALARAGGAPDAGNVLWLRADWSASKVLPQV